MAIECIDISENKRLDSVSPIATVVFLACFMILTMLMDLGIFWLIAVVTTGLLTYMFFQYSPRYVFIMFEFLFKHYYLVPSFDDTKYLHDHTKIDGLNRISENYEKNIDED